MNHIPQIHVACLPPQNNSPITGLLFFFFGSYDRELQLCLLQVKFYPPRFEYSDHASAFLAFYIYSGRQNVTK